MLSYFPQVYPGELLYSVLARYHRHTGSSSPKGTAEELFGRSTAIAAVDLQGSLGVLAERIPPGRGLTSEALAREHTLYPYYTSFEPPEMAAHVLRSLVQGSADGVHLKLGIAASTVSPPEHLRYCLSCRAEMLARSGELYWRREHQLPGVLVCPEHGCPLADSSVRLTMTNRHEFVAAHEGNCAAVAVVPSWAEDRHAVELLRWIAVASAALLCAPPRSGNLQEEYRRGAIERGFGKGNRIAQGKLAAAYAAMIGPIARILPEADGSDWLSEMTRKHRKAFHPLRHVLFRLFLEGQERRKPSPFGTGPWPCLNRLADHYGRRVVTRMQLHYDRGHAIARFTCICGHVYALADGARSKPRILEFGPLFDEGFRGLVAGGNGLRETARALCVDPGTIRLHATRLELKVPWKARKEGRAKRRFDRDAIRGRWLAAQAEQPGLSRKQLGAFLQAERSWLYRNDRDWLDLNSPPPSTASRWGKRLDWPTIDCHLAVELRDAAHRLIRETPPQRVSAAALERLLGRPGWIGKRTEKLPRTIEALGQVVETLEDFRLRRVFWAAAALEREGLPVQAWRIRRLAGLPAEVSMRVEEAL
ncbi:TnsD family transposase [Rhodomicrobium sp. Az07]|uniref:TnsD family Tn7-like transposition protein n=1 Tax=Rhodomicrobium sp. Az07 TaxID=2839034 RepID=UPI001BE61739|nr:TnsD family Tn7-like transposition protein [Rhodomicrobium sp. Az07]MBT3072197.1 TnsD family transposase [Rhodomicrobium sp. Az07]